MFQAISLNFFLKLNCDQFQPKGNGKYVFDIGAEQLGEYLTTVQVSVT